MKVNQMGRYVLSVVASGERRSRLGEVEIPGFVFRMGPCEKTSKHIRRRFAFTTH